MPRHRKHVPLKPNELDALWQQAAISIHPMPTGIEALYGLLTTTTKKPEEMYCFLMYDIENNRVRRLVAKYLEKKGCERVQKSVFFAKLHRNMHREICETLRKIQQTYQNHDSILILPVGEDMLNGLNIIGKDFDWEVRTATKHTLIF